MNNTVILANIGNRNIKYLNQGYINDEIPKRVFFEKTKFLWEHEEEIANVTLSILPAIIERYPNANLYLFTSLQDPVFEQDTFYEGKVIEKILQKSYPSLHVEIRVIEGVKANNEDELIPWYRNELNGIRRINGIANYIMYDTGGTPQQKNSLKSVVEFYFKRSTKEIDSMGLSYELFQGNDDLKGGTIIEQIKRTASEKLNQLTNIKLLVQHNNYAAAKEIAIAYDFKSLIPVLNYAWLRWDNMWQEINRLHNAASYSKQVKTIEEFAEVKLNDSSCNDFTKSESIDGLSLLACRDCRNLLSKTENQHISGNLSGSILSFHQFIETYVAAYIEANSEFPIYSDYYKAGPNLLKCIKTNHFESCMNQFGSIPFTTTFPVLIYFAILISENNDHSLEFLENIRDTQSFFKSDIFPNNKKLDSLRNAVAHDGKGVTATEFSLYLPLINKAYKKFIKSTDPFKSLNQIIEKLM